MNLRNVTIDKTARIEELLKEHKELTAIDRPARNGEKNSGTDSA